MRFTIWTGNSWKKVRRLKSDKNAFREQLLLYAVTDRRWLKGETLSEQVEKALKGGVTFVQLREKNLNEEDFLAEAAEIRELCGKYGVPFVVNDNVEVALKSGADGVHVGQSDMEAGNVRKLIGKERILGVSAQTVEQALLAQERGADYLGVGAVFSTGSKADAEDVSFETLAAICDAVDIPVIAIGGITCENTAELAGSGICGIAVISSLFGSRDIEKAAEELSQKAGIEIRCQKRPGNRGEAASQSRRNDGAPDDLLIFDVEEEGTRSSREEIQKVHALCRALLHGLCGGQPDHEKRTAADPEPREHAADESCQNGNQKGQHKMSLAPPKRIRSPSAMCKNRAETFLNQSPANTPPPAPPRR